MMLKMDKLGEKEVDLDQQKQLFNLLRKAEKSVFGRTFGFSDIRSYESFVSRVPVQSFESLNPFFARIKSGEPNVLWPGVCERWAVSAGTTGNGKHLPVTEDRLSSDLRFQRKVAWEIIRRMGIALALRGKHLSIPGTVEPINENGRNLLIGEISGHLAFATPDWLSRRQWKLPSLLARMDWAAKMQAAKNYVSKNLITVLTGVPTWLKLLSETCAYPEKCRLVVTGGVKLNPFLSEIRKNLNPDVQFMENYGASEGYFAFGWQTGDDFLNLVSDNGIFYEGESTETGEILPLTKAHPNVLYKLIVTTNSGLWRYKMDDLVEVSHTNGRAKLKITGRDSLILDDYGEAVYQYEYEQILADETQFPWFVMAEWRPGEPARHILFHAHRLADPIILDQKLIHLNRHYGIRRQTGVLAKLELKEVEVSLLMDLEVVQLRRAQSKVRRVFSNQLLLKSNKQIEINELIGRLKQCF